MNTLMAFLHNSEFNITIWRPIGLITLDEITTDLIEFVQLEKNKPSFNRFSDISACDFANIKFDDIRQIYLLRKKEYQGGEVKSVFYIETDLQYGIGRIYQTLMLDTPIKVELFKTPEECANNLNVPLEILFPNSK